MDRGRESRRGGGGGPISGHPASRRRPRSGLKDSAAALDEEDGLNESHDSTRLRERSSSNTIHNSNNNKKERSSLPSSRNKRRRPGLPERFHGGGRDRDNDEGDESSEESPVEEEEEDDDEPPHRPLPNHRRTKFKSQWKVSEDMVGVGHVQVPRKARSVSVKRPHESTSSAVLLTSGVSDGCAHRRQKSPSPVRPTVVPASPSSSNQASVKPGRRMKPIGIKPRPSKMAKVSNSISEREVEVAEVLFGLTRQFHNHHPALESYAYANANASNPDAKDYSNDVSPLPTSSVVSSPISTSISPPPPSSPALTLPHHSISAPTPPTAPKKKRPRPAKPEEANPASAMRPPVSVSAPVTMPTIASGARNDTEPAYQAIKMEISSLKSEADTVFSGGIPSVATTTCASSIFATPNHVSTTPIPLNQTDESIASEKIATTKYADLISITAERTADAKISDLKMTTEELVDGHSPDLKTIPSDKVRGVNSADVKSVTNDDTLETKESNPADVSEDMNKLVPDISDSQSDQITKKEIDVPTNDLSSCPEKKMENANMLLQPPKTESVVEEKFKFDLMAPPEKSSFDTDDDSVPDAIGNGVPEVTEEGTGEITDISEVKAVTVKEERQSDKMEDELRVEETEKNYHQRDEGGGKILEEHIKEQRGIYLQLDGEKLENMSSKPLPQKQSRAVRNESRSEKPEKPALEVAAVANVGGSSSAVTSMPISMTVPGWPGALPLGYFAPAAANWPPLPGVVPMDGADKTPAMQPPYIFQKSRQTWKRCATHSYIAHFIECQLRISRQPFCTVANYFGPRQYNLNAPLAPSSEIINLGSSIPGTVSPATAGNSVPISRGLESTQEKNIGSFPLSSKEKTFNYMDARRKQPSHQQATQQISSTIMQPGHGFALSTTQSGAGVNCSSAGSTVNVGSLVNGGNAAVGAVPSFGTGPPNNNLASMGADAQYMAMLQQSGMLQQGGYSFAISPHIGATYGGASNHVVQQPAQFFNPHFYATQSLHPPHPQPQPQSQQQGPQNPSTSSGSSSSQQHKQQLPGSRNFSSSQKQQQQGTPSPSPSNSQHHHHMPMTQARHVDREANNGGDSPSTADSRLPVLQKTFYGPGSISSSNLSVTSPSLLAQVQAQDPALSTALGGKHNGKQQQQQPTPPQIQHQVAAGYNIQQHHGNGPTFQMTSKDLELSQPQAQAISAMNRNLGVLCFPPMAQGHAMSQGMPEFARHQMAVQAQQNTVQPSTQPQHSGQMQRTQPTSTGDGRSSIDSMNNAGGRGSEEERKSSMKGGIGHSLNFPRIETENCTNTWASPTDGSHTTSLVANSIGQHKQNSECSSSWKWKPKFSSH
ncbi:hypothetical protein KI387_013432 [Taxus chinensis]|uniref:Time for coffee n=1 Tax=Taxus chinensis TaxID=29808 RepID=A0AA38CRX2_TAXCH|nr:hypothetical protein KI387_013432 [Taxus chinensis]